MYMDIPNYYCHIIVLKTLYYMVKGYLAMFCFCLNVNKLLGCNLCLTLKFSFHIRFVFYDLNFAIVNIKLLVHHMLCFLKRGRIF